MKIIKKILNEMTGQILACYRAERKIKKDIAKLDKPARLVYRGASTRPLLAKDTLLRFLQQEHDRRMTIEDKAKQSLWGITMAVSIMLASVAFLPGIHDIDIRHGLALFYVHIAFLGTGVLFLLIGGIYALKVLRIAPIHLWALKEERTITTPEEQNATVENYINHNEKQTLLKSNNLDASYACIRNGLICCAIAFAILVWL